MPVIKIEKVNEPVKLSELDNFALFKSERFPNIVFMQKGVTHKRVLALAVYDGNKYYDDLTRRPQYKAEIFNEDDIVQEVKFISDSFSEKISFQKVNVRSEVNLPNIYFTINSEDGVLNITLSDGFETREVHDSSDDKNVNNCFPLSSNNIYSFTVDFDFREQLGEELDKTIRTLQKIKNVIHGPTV